MGRPINKKIESLLRERDFNQKDLANTLGISSQSLQEIIKGRTTVNVPVIQGLVRFFKLRADYWVDDQKDDPTPNDVIGGTSGTDQKANERLGLSIPQDSAGFKKKVEAFIKNHPEEWATQFGPLTREELDLLEEKTPEQE